LTQHDQGIVIEQDNQNTSYRPPRWARAAERVVFARRPLLLAVFAVLTGWLGYRATQLQIDAGFDKQLPQSHAYMETFRQYRDEFGGANRLLIAVRSRAGDIFNPEFFATAKEVTNAVFFLPGINRSTVTSVFTPNVRFVEVVEGGFVGGNVIPADFSPTRESLALVRENMIKAGVVGRLVASDFSAIMVSSQLLEVDPRDRQPIDNLEVARALEEQIRDRFADEDVDIHIIGFAKAVGDVADGATEVLFFFCISFAITALLVFFFTHSIRMTLLPLVCSTIAVIWNLGLLTSLGFGIDPMSILVPFLTFAIGVSHAVQVVNAAGTGLTAGRTMYDSARGAFARLLVPGSVALLSDSVGFLTILWIDIPMIQELAITATIGVSAILMTNLVLLPVLISYQSVTTTYIDRLRHSNARRDRVWSALSRCTRPRVATLAIVIATSIGVWAAFEAQGLVIGDTRRGVPELREDSRFNRDSREIAERFSIGIDLLTTIVETIPNGCVEHDVMEAIDDFSWEVLNIEGVQSTLALPAIAKQLNGGWNEGHPKWRVLPRDPQSLAQSVSRVETDTGLLNADCSVIPVLIFMDDHKAETIRSVVTSIEDFANRNDTDRHRFRLATGNVGVMAATNEAVDRAQESILIYIYSAVIALCLVTFRSVRATICIVVPLTLVSVLCYALMSLLGIGLKVSTLPVAALGVGIGVDYGIYMFSRFARCFRRSGSVTDAYQETLRTTGNAVILTGLTLGIGVSTWLLSDLQFQADMGLLLAFMFLANMLGAILLLPALARFLYRDSH